MVVGEGFEPSKLSRQIYSLIPLTAREPHQREAGYSLDFTWACQDIFHPSFVVPAVGLELTTY